MKPVMPAVLMTASNVSFLSRASLLVFKSVTTNDRVFGSTASTGSAIGSISFSLKYFAYFVTLSFSWSVGDFLFFVFCSCDDQETDVSGGLCAGGIVLADENDKSSGFGEGSMSLNMSCDVFVGEFIVGELGVGSFIVAF